jgi:hypothetical protein
LLGSTSGELVTIEGNWRFTLRAARALRGELGLLADVITILTFAGSIYALVTGRDLPQAVLAAYVGALAASLFVWNVRIARRARQSAAMPRLVDALDSVSHGTRALLAGGANDAFVLSLKAALADLAEMYGISTGVACRVTVKITYSPPEPKRQGDLAVKTVCRSTGDAGGSSPSGIDWIDDNTDFRKIFKDGAALFFCNDIPAEIAKGLYRNSHFTDEMVASGDLPYRATIVWPVRSRLDFPEQTDSWEVIGFLCVDTAGTGAFDRALDEVPGAAFAHALYSGLLRFRENQDAPRSTSAVKGKDRRQR